MSFKAMAWAASQKLPAMQKIVLLMLANRTDEKGFCYPSQEQIADDCGMSKRSAISQVDALEKIGLIQVIRPKIGSRSGCKYYLNLHATLAGGATDKTEHLQDVQSSLAIDATVHLQDVQPKQSFETINETINSSSLAETKKEISEPESEPALTAEMQGCFDWAIQHDFWKNSVTSINKFLTLYTNNKPNGLKAQYLRFLQAQKNLLESDGNQAGFQSVNTTNKVINYEDYSRKSNTKKLSTADKQLYSVIRGEYYDKYERGEIDRSTYEWAMREYASQ